MLSNFGTNNQSLRKKRVWFEGSDTLREGMAFCYNHDTTNNHLGYDKGNSVKGSTTAEGYQNEGKYWFVEAPSAANQKFFAGVLAGKSHAGKAGPRHIDIYEPNGGVAVVWTDRSVSINDIAYLEPGELTVVNTATAGGLAIGVFMETVDRSSTAGLALCKIVHPNVEGELAADSTLGIGQSPLLWGDAPVVDPYSPSDDYIYFEDFDREVDVTSGDGWTLTQVDTKGSITVEAVAPGGVLEVTSATGDSADDGISAQLKNLAVLPAAGTNIWFEARVKVSDATQQWFAGLMAVDTTPLASGVLDDVSDKVGFVHAAADTDNKVSTVTARTSAEDETSDAGDMTDDTWTTIGFKITGLTSVEFYQDGALIETGVTAANIPNAAMCLTLASYYESADNILSVDWVKVLAQGVGRDA
jgi:hypothetical protein